MVRSGEGYEAHMAAGKVSRSDRAALSGGTVGCKMGERAQPAVYKRFFCSFPDCDAGYNKDWKLQAHLCKHTGQEGCTKGFTSCYHLTRHTLTHTGERNFKCDCQECDMKFTTMSNMKKHFNRAHNRERFVYVCNFVGCNQSFKKHNQLKVHQCIHTGQKPFKCTHEGCDKSFSVPSRLKRHEKVHSGYPCNKENCSFVGQTWTLYLKHVSECHEEPVICDVCNRTFKQKSYLKDHKRTHEKERTVYRCPREDCDRTYTTLFNLQSHMLSFHEGQHPFVCPHDGCEKSFSMKQSLERHTVVHDPEKRKLKEKIPRPKRSLASRLSGYKPPRKGAKDTEPTGENNPVNLCASETNSSALENLRLQ
ncbi:hypothetical protein GDO86_004604 [Hymenochirus boettgeri]|uniref:Transcription factor IIIA n=1 Tax=Hymenochirus boettgeri TaxID=247094 RepID=A0A8T2KBA3_9PIPI|nr:hypothetical protein GDO86_004604 [Hymenochirus boettgeri]